MTIGHQRASSAGAVADAIASWIDDRFRLKSDTVQSNRRFVASFCGVAVPLVDGAGRRVTVFAGRAGQALSRGLWSVEQKGSEVAGEVADEVAGAGREGARAIRDAAASSRNGSTRGATTSAPDAGQAPDGAGLDAALVGDEDLVEVEVVEIVELSDGSEDVGFLGEGLDQDLDAEVDDDLDTELDTDLDDDLLDESMLDEVPPPALADEIAHPVADAVGVHDLEGDPDVLEDPVTAEAVERMTGGAGGTGGAGDTAAERRAGRRTTGSRPRTEARPARRTATPRSGRRETTSSNGRSTRG